MAISKNSFLYKNGLSIVVLSLFLIFLFCQLLTGWHVKNSELAEHQIPPLTLFRYFLSPHFMQATFENWESEFLQMGMYVVLTVILRQKGSAESKSMTELEEVDKDPVAHKNAPWAVKKGGFVLSVYKHSLSISFGILFVLSFALHFIGSLNSYNEEQVQKSLALLTWEKYIFNSQFWFESFQNWQSEFLAVASLVILSIWFREKGSPESKPIDRAHSEN